MRYQGGKSKMSGNIAEILGHFRSVGQTYLEPFLGAASVFCRMGEPKIGSDTHLDLILMWESLQRGWDPPERLTKDQYLALRDSPPSALRAFAGFGLSFGGKWFGGYASQRADAAQARRSVLRRTAKMMDSVFLCCDYSSWEPEDMLIYCDPPYEGTEAYGKRNQFDHPKFWSKMREWSEHNTVLVSEFSAPDDFVNVRERERGIYWRYRDASRTRPSEKLFIWGEDPEGLERAGVA